MKKKTHSCIILVITYAVSLIQVSLVFLVYFIFIFGIIDFIVRERDAIIVDTANYLPLDLRCSPFGGNYKLHFFCYSCISNGDTFNSSEYSFGKPDRCYFAF